MTDTKTCNKCGEKKKLDQFYERRATCRNCFSEQRQARRSRALAAATVSNVPEFLLAEGAPNVYQKPGETFWRPAWHLKVYGGNKS